MDSTWTPQSGCPLARGGRLLPKDSLRSPCYVRIAGKPCFVNHLRLPCAPPESSTLSDFGPTAFRLAFGVRGPISQTCAIPEMFVSFGCSFGSSAQQTVVFWKIRSPRSLIARNLPLADMDFVTNSLSSAPSSAKSGWRTTVVAGSLETHYRAPGSPDSVVFHLMHEIA